MDESRDEADGRRPRRSYDEAFKRDAVRLVSDEKYSFASAAQAVGVSEQSLRIWHGKFAPAAPPCGENASVQELRDEVARLRKQLKRAELQREILKKGDGGALLRYCGAKE
ncbi:MAG: transposase [Pirellulales bacterium]|nr:transposase [Pirellulales bacterium]